MKDEKTLKKMMRQRLTRRWPHISTCTRKKTEKKADHTGISVREGEENIETLTER